MQNGHKKQMVISLRLRGYSLGAIAKETNISKSTISLWCHKISIPDKIIHSLIVSGRTQALKTKKLKKILQKKVFDKKVEKDIGIFTSRDLFILGLGLYWAEGAKPHKHLSLTNMDVSLIKVFLDFCHEYFHLSHLDFRYRIQINSRKIEEYEKILKYWCDILQIFPSCFTKPSIIKTKKISILKENNERYRGVLRVTARKSAKNNSLILSLIERIKILASS